MQRIKVIPSDVRLTPLALACWYMGDGNNNWRACNLTLATHNFSEAEVDRLIGLLKAVGFPHVVKHSGGKEGQYGIRILKHSYLGFLDCVRNALENVGGVPECMEYKIDTS